MGKNDDYEYKAHDLVKTFNGPDGKLSPGMQAIFGSIKAIAIDDLNEEDFRKFYETEYFIMGDFTDIMEGNEKVGFLYATFYYNPNKIPQYTAKAFQAVVKAKRQTKKPYDRSKLYAKFISFYFEKILLLQLLNNGINSVARNWLVKGRNPNLSDIKKLIKASLDSVKKEESLQIEIFAENPTTYYDISCRYKLTHESVKPKSGELDWLDKLTPADLLLESYRLSKQYDEKKVNALRTLKKQNLR